MRRLFALILTLAIAGCTTIENHYTVTGDANRFSCPSTAAPDKAIYQAVPADVSPKQLTPVEFKMCFTSAERLAITAIRDNAEHQASPTLKDVYSILDDPRLKIVDLGLQSNLDLIDFLVSLNVLTSDRAAEIKDGVLK